MSGQRNALTLRALGVAAFVTVALLGIYVVRQETPLGVSPLGAGEFIGFGVLVGAYGTMVGAGGGFLIVPALLLVHRADPGQAVGTSLAVVFLNALSGSVSYARQKRIDYRAGATFAVATLPGAVAGAFLARLFTGPVFHLVFGGVLLLISGLLIWRPLVEEEYAGSLVDQAEAARFARHRRLTDFTGEVFEYRYNVLVGVALSFFVGFLSSILGIGGGIIHVPALIHLLGFPAHVATATSHFILVIAAGAGALTHLALGHVQAGPAILLGIGVLGGAQVGAWLSHRLQGSLVVRLLSLALAVVAIRLLLG